MLGAQHLSGQQFLVGFALRGQVHQLCLERGSLGVQGARPEVAHRSAAAVAACRHQGAYERQLCTASQVRNAVLNVFDVKDLHR